MTTATPQSRARAFYGNTRNDGAGLFDANAAASAPKTVAAPPPRPAGVPGAVLPPTARGAGPLLTNVANVANVDPDNLACRQCRRLTNFVPNLFRREWTAENSRCTAGHPELPENLDEWHLCLLATAADRIAPFEFAGRATA